MFSPPPKKRSAGGAERSSRGREGEKFLIFTGPEGKPGGESRLPLSFKTDGVFNTKLFKKKQKKTTNPLNLELRDRDCPT